MLIRYAVSLWNFTHYSRSPSLERAIASVREQGYGVEVWGKWQEETDLFDEIGRRRLAAALEGMPVSLHTAGARTLEMHKKQIDAAAHVGADVIVIHPNDIKAEGNPDVDVALAGEAVAYASKSGVKLALENGGLADLVTAIDNVEGLGICIDVGHIYATPDPMSAYLDALKERLIHLHIQDILPDSECHLFPNRPDHFVPGTGGIPEQDWRLLVGTLKEIDFQGTAVFEIRPRNPLQTALLGKAFFQQFVDDK